MSYSFWRPPTLAPGGACPSDPPSYATGYTVILQETRGQAEDVLQ